MAGTFELSTLNVISPNGLYTTSLATSDSNAFVMPKAIDLTAGQIKFPATQVSSSDANTLDDYEEGTWIPSIGGTATYTRQTGYYTKIGNLVTLIGIVQLTAIGTGSATTISGLPFDMGSTRIAGGMAFWGNLNTAIMSMFPYAIGTTVNFIGQTTTNIYCVDPLSVFNDSAYVYFAITGRIV